VFVNPLLFESVVSEQDTKKVESTGDYYIKMDGSGKETKMGDKFTQVVDGTYKGTPGGNKKKTSSGSNKKKTGSGGDKTVTPVPTPTPTPKPTPTSNVVTDDILMLSVKKAVNELDGWVDEENLATVLKIVKSLNGRVYFDEEVGKNIPASKRFLELYSEDEGGDSFVGDVQSVGTRTLATGSEKVKSVIVKTINSQAAQPVA